MSGEPSKEPQPQTSRKCKKVEKCTRDSATQCGMWLSLKKAVEKDEKIRTEVLDNIDNVLAFLGPRNGNPPTPEDERDRIETREALASHQIADLALSVQPLSTCMWRG